MRNLRNTLFIAIITIFLVPIAAFFFHPTAIKTSFLNFILLVVWGITSTALFIYLTLVFEKRMRKKVALLVLDRIKRVEMKVIKSKELQGKSPYLNSEKIAQLTKEMEDGNKKREEMEKNLLSLNQEKIDWEKNLIEMKLELQEQIDKREAMLSEYRSTCAEQRLIIEKKQEDIRSMKLRINDLTHEVRSLLQLKDHPELSSQEENLSLLTSRGRTQELKVATISGIDAMRKEKIYVVDSPEHELKRYVSVASKLMGASHLGGCSDRVSPFSLEGLIIDQRRLFESFQNEDDHVILIYSPKEGQLIFANRVVKNLLGWSSEKFVKLFSTFVQKGLAEWTKTINDLSPHEIKKVPLLIKTRSGKDLLSHCYLATVPNGNFQGYVIGVLERE